MSEFVTIPSDPKTRARLKNAAIEISNALTQIDAQKDHIKNIVDDVSEETEVDKKYIKKMGTVYHKSSFQDLQADAESFDSLYETIMIDNE